jgi:hypothetical protein
MIGGMIPCLGSIFILVAHFGSLLPLFLAPQLRRPTNCKWSFFFVQQTLTQFRYYDRRISEVNHDIQSAVLHRMEPGYRLKITSGAKMWVTSMDFEVSSPFHLSNNNSFSCGIIGSIR